MEHTQRHEVNFGKSKYHLQQPMIDWLRDNIGIGQWTSGPADWDGANVWYIWCMFGNTTFSFKNPADATAFSLRWV